MICPMCKQDEVVKARVIQTGRCIFICPECDSVWFDINDIGSDKVFFYETIMKLENIPPYWSELEVLKQ